MGDLTSYRRPCLPQHSQATRSMMTTKHTPIRIIWIHRNRLRSLPNMTEQEATGSYHRLDLSPDTPPGVDFHRHLYPRDPTHFLHCLTKILWYLAEKNHMRTSSSGRLVTVAAVLVPS